MLANLGQREGGTQKDSQSRNVRKMAFSRKGTHVSLVFNLGGGIIPRSQIPVMGLAASSFQLPVQHQCQQHGLKRKHVQSRCPTLGFNLLEPSLAVR